MQHFLNNPIIQSIVGSVAAHPYAALFIGLIVGGETILVPAIFLAVRGILDMWTVFGIAMVATLISDTGWYYLGILLPTERIMSLKTIRKRAMLFERLGDLFDRYGEVLLFASKWVYGSRITAQVLSGVHKMPILRYQLVNLAGVAVYTGFLISIGYVVNASVERFTALTDTLQWSFLIFVLVTTLVFLGIRHIARPWFQS